MKLEGPLDYDFGEHGAICAKCKRDLKELGQYVTVDRCVFCRACGIIIWMMGDEGRQFTPALRNAPDAGQIGWLNRAGEWRTKLA